MKKYLKLLCVALIGLVFVSGCSADSNQVSSSNQVATSQTKQKNYKQMLDNAKTIKIEEAMLSLGKEYDIYVDDEQVATINGKIFNGFGDTFTMTDTNGNFLIKEDQAKRWGMKYTRAAQISDENDNVLGYIGEETLSKLFSLGYVFHFFDKNKNEIGESDQIIFSLWKQNDFYNNDKTLAYHVDENFSLNDSYNLTVKDSSKIPLYDAILMVCIEDAIHDASKKK